MAGGVTRAEKVAIAQNLRARGHLQREIAEVLGVGRSMVGEYLTDPDRTKIRARRERYGTCLDCGASTNGSNGRAKAPVRCEPCYHVWRGTEEGHEHYTLWKREDIIAAIQWWARLYGEPPATADWNPTQARYLRNEARARRFERHFAAGEVPWFVTVVRRFGTWNEGIEAAGFEPRVASGGNGNLFRMRHRVPLAQAQELRAQGLSYQEIADRLGFSQTGVIRALKEAS